MSTTTTSRTVRPFKVKGRAPTTKRVKPNFDHPAKFSNSEMRWLDVLLPDDALVLDPMAGVGRIHELMTADNDRTTYGIEIEPEWAATHERTDCADSTNLAWIPDNTFDAVATSVTYGNRMADHHDAKDACKHCQEGKVRKTPRSRTWEDCKKCGGSGLSKRNTYKHVLGHDLVDNNTGAMQWGQEYKRVNLAILTETTKKLKPGGDFILVVSDHIRKDEHQYVVAWYVSTMQRLGYTLVNVLPCGIPRNRNGKNAEKRVDASLVLHYKKKHARR